MLSQLRPLSPQPGEEQPLGLYFYHLSLRQGWISVLEQLGSRSSAWQSVQQPQHPGTR